MTTRNKNTEKKKYQSPAVETILLDNEISLAMESNTNPESEPGGGGWSANNMNSSHTDPYKNMM